MALPSLPPVLGAGQSMRRVAPGNVPPTPTRLSMRGSIAAAPAPASSLLGPSASVPIATTLEPPTPAALHHPGYAADKASFLAPSEVFYDALRDAKELKAYLAEQLLEPVRGEAGGGRRGAYGGDGHRLITSETSWPPKPNEVVSAAEWACSRGVIRTTSRSTASSGSSRLRTAGTTWSRRASTVAIAMPNPP